MNIEQHKLTDIAYKESPNQSSTIQPDTIIIHYTAGANAESSIATLTDADEGVSAHVVISKDGEITQLVPFNKKAWHAGTSHYRERTGMNRYSIGIELDNPGVLKKAGNQYVSWFGKKYPEEDVVQEVHRNEDFSRYWHTFTEEQISRVYELCKLLIKEYGIKHILGHEEVSPGRKLDPGPAFPLDKLRDKLLLEDRSSDEPDELPEQGVVAATKLNFRDAPGIQGNKIAKPLEQGTNVKIIGREGEWLKVVAPVEGWIMGKYLKTDDS